MLLVQRAQSPNIDLWSLPGGHVEVGETTREAALRELSEETGVSAEIVGLVDVVDVIRRSADAGVQAHYVIAAYCALYLSGKPTPSTECRAAAWFDLQVVSGFNLTPGLLEIVPRAADLIRERHAERS